MEIVGRLTAFIYLFDYSTIILSASSSCCPTSSKVADEEMPPQAWHLYDCFFLRYVLIGQASERAFGKGRRPLLWMSRSPESDVYRSTEIFCAFVCASVSSIVSFVHLC